MSDTLVYDAAVRVFDDLSTTEVVNAAEAGTWSAALWDAVSEAGFLDALGGDGTDAFDGLADAVAVLRAAGRYAVPLPLPETMLARWLARRAGLTPPEGPLAVLVESAEDRVVLARAGAGWHLSVTARAVPWGRDARALMVATGAAVALLAPVGQAITRGDNLAGEPRDDITLDRALDAKSVSDAPAGVDAAVVYRLGALLRAAQIAGALEESALISTAPVASLSLTILAGRLLTAPVTLTTNCGLIL